MQHTPGPWTASRLDGDARFAYAITNGVEIARANKWPLSDAEALANARLIAAAPELLEALEWLVAEASANAYPKALAELGAIGRASAAIAAARGDA